MQTIFTKHTLIFLSAICFVCAAPAAIKTTSITDRHLRPDLLNQYEKIIGAKGKVTERYDRPTHDLTKYVEYMVGKLDKCLITARAWKSVDRYYDGGEKRAKLTFLNNSEYKKILRNPRNQQFTFNTSRLSRFAWNVSDLSIAFLLVPFEPHTATDLVKTAKTPFGPKGDLSIAVSAGREKQLGSNSTLTHNARIEFGINCDSVGAGSLDYEIKLKDAFLNSILVKN